MTLYTFSTENWKRPKKEVKFLFDLIRKSLKKNLNTIIKNEIRINIIGKKRGLPKDISRIIKFIQKKTIKNKKITLNLAINYGSKEEIVNACRRFLTDKNKRFDVKSFEKKLYTNDIPDPDILIRTGGNKRLSNFLLWQLAYTEIFFIEKLWPDFDEKDYNRVINKFYNIKRRFGGVND